MCHETGWLWPFFKKCRQWCGFTGMLPGFEIRKEEGATGTTASMNLKYTESASLSTNGFTKPGWKLIGWSTEENASVPVYQPKQNGWNINK